MDTLGNRRKFLFRPQAVATFFSAFGDGTVPDLYARPTTQRERTFYVVLAVGLLGWACFIPLPIHEKLPGARLLDAERTGSDTRNERAMMIDVAVLTPALAALEIGTAIHLRNPGGVTPIASGRLVAVVCHAVQESEGGISRAQATLHIGNFDRAFQGASTPTDVWYATTTRSLIGRFATWLRGLRGNDFIRGCAGYGPN